MKKIYWLRKDETAIENGPHRWPTTLNRHGVSCSSPDEEHIRAAYGRPAPDVPDHDKATQKLGPVSLDGAGGELFIPVIDLTAEELQALQMQMQQVYIDGVQAHMDGVAVARGYDNIFTLCTYAASTHPVFGAEGKIGLEWRDAVWSFCHVVLAAVASEKRTAPTLDELISELPAIAWPS